MEHSHRNYLPPEYRDELQTGPDADARLADVAGAHEPGADARSAGIDPTGTQIVVADAMEIQTAEPDAAPVKKTAEHPLISLSHWFSALFSPLLIGTYGLLLAMWLSYLVYSPFKVKAIVVAVTFVATCIIPVISIFILSRIGAISDPSLNARKDRKVPYIVAALCYAGVAVYYHFVNAPGWLMMFALGSGLALLIMTGINSRWKISAHACGAGGMIGLLFFLMCSGNSVDNIQWQFMAGVLVAGCVCTSRLILERHTPWQVAAGTALGFACVFFPAWFIHF